jgi:hypothetical protein
MRASVAETGWIGGRRFDGFFFFGSSLLAGAAGLAVLAWPVLLLPLWAAWLLLLDGPHLLATFGRTYLDARERKERARLLVGSLLFFVPGLVAWGLLRLTGERAALDLFLGFATLWSFHHAVRQNYGLLSLSRASRGPRPWSGSSTPGSCMSRCGPRSGCSSWATRATACRRASTTSGCLQFLLGGMAIPSPSGSNPVRPHDERMKQMVEYNLVEVGYPNALPMLKSKINGYRRYSDGIYIGVSSDPELRWLQHAGNGWEKMAVIYKAFTPEIAREAEQELIAYARSCNFLSDVENGTDGGEGIRDQVRYNFLYILIR